MLVHCAQGHGRSAVVVAAWLLLKGRAQDPEEALIQIKAARPGVRLHEEHLALLGTVQLLRLGTPCSRPPPNRQ